MCNGINAFDNGVLSVTTTNMEPVKLKDVQGPPIASMLEERFEQIKELYTNHGPRQSYATLVLGLVKQHVASIKELVLLDIKARTKAIVQWLSGDCVQPVATAPLLPPFKTWPGVALFIREQRVSIPNSYEATALERLKRELEGARLITTQLGHLINESKKVLAPPLPAHPNNHSQAFSDSHSLGPIVAPYVPDVVAKACELKA